MQDGSYRNTIHHKEQHSGMRAVHAPKHMSRRHDYLPVIHSACNHVQSLPDYDYRYKHRTQWVQEQLP